MGVHKLGNIDIGTNLTKEVLNKQLSDDYVGIGVFPSWNHGVHIKRSDIKKNTNKKPIDKCEFLYSEYVNNRSKITNKFGSLNKLEFLPTLKTQQLLHKVTDNDINFNIVYKNYIDYVIGFAKNFGTFGQFEAFLYKTCDKLLDFGSGNGNEWLLKITKEYYTLDKDPNYETTFDHIDEIPDDLKFNAIISNQVFEHIEKDKLPNITKKLSSLLLPKGKIMITIPNVHNWYHYLCDFDHKSPLMYWDIGSLLESSGITVTNIYFYTKTDKFMEIQRDLHDELNRRLFQFVTKNFYLHPADFIAIVGEKR